MESVISDGDDYGKCSLVTNWRLHSWWLLCCKYYDDVMTVITDDKDNDWNGGSIHTETS